MTSGDDRQRLTIHCIVSVVGFIFISLGVAVDGAVPNIPLAELLFAPYNPKMARLGGATAVDGESTGNSASKDFCFISHGCWGGKPPQSEKQREVAALIAELIETAEQDPAKRDERIRFVVAAGDNFYRHGVKNVQHDRFYTTFEDFYRGRNQSGGVRRVPWLVALGNHDYYGNWSAQVQYTYAVRDQATYSEVWAHHSPPEAPVSGRWYMPYPYYAVKVSLDMVVVVIDTVLLHRCSERVGDCWDGGRQKRVVEDWLLHEFAAVPYKVVVGHYPVLANGPHMNYEWLQSWLIPLMAKSCASLYINADNHYLQVSKKGFQYYANSGGGAGLGLHYTLKYKSWAQKESIFHSVEYGLMLHCKKGDRFTHSVMGTSGKELFRFASWDSEDGAPLQDCLVRLEAGGVARGETRDVSMWVILLPPMLLVALFISVRRRNRMRNRRCA